MKKLMLAALFAFGATVGLEAAPTDTVTKADIQAILTRLSKLEAENKAQAAKIAELERENRVLTTDMKVTKAATSELQTQKLSKISTAYAKVDEGTTTNETGRVFTTSNGKKYYLADATANIFEPLSESGLQITPYGYLVFEGVWSDRPLDCDWSTDFVMQKERQNNTTLSMQDSIMGIQFMTPEAYAGWKFSGKAEFDLAGGNQNSYDFHWRHLYINAEHESGWSILFGQTWHLWKMVTPSEIDGAWMENAGHPYRRSPQLRVTKKWDWEKSSLEARVGIVKGGPGMGGDRDANGVQDNSDSAWALFEGALLYDHDTAWEANGNRWLVGLGGMYGRTRAGQYWGDDGNDEYDSMMLMLAGQVPFWNFTLTGQIFAGKNLGGIQAGCAQTIVYNYYTGEGHGVRTIGGFIDLNYKFNEKWSAAIGYGFDNPNDDDATGYCDGTSNILFNDRAYIAAFYSITSNFRLGLEYARLMTRYAENEGQTSSDYDANRLQFSAFFDF